VRLFARDGAAISPLGRGYFSVQVWLLVRYLRGKDRSVFITEAAHETFLPLWEQGLEQTSIFFSHLFITLFFNM